MKARNERKRLCPQNTPTDADEDFIFLICVNLDVLRASPVLVAIAMICLFAESLNEYSRMQLTLSPSKDAAEGLATCLVLLPPSLVVRSLQITADMRLVHASLGDKIPAASCHFYLFPPPKLEKAMG